MDIEYVLNAHEANENKIEWLNKQIGSLFEKYQITSEQGLIIIPYKDSMRELYPKIEIFPKTKKGIDVIPNEGSPNFYVCRSIIFIKLDNITYRIHLKPKY